jgi:Fe-S-cluster-containing hydrogenase component 2
MKTLKELYASEAALALDPAKMEEVCAAYDPAHLDCLLNPRSCPVVVRAGECDCAPEHRAECAARCAFDAMTVGPDGNIAIDRKCVGCAGCIDACEKKNIVAGTDVVAALKAVRGAKGLAYALIAPAYLGQFSEAVTPGKLRSASGGGL